jgi:phage RecT family recombinase
MARTTVRESIDQAQRGQDPPGQQVAAKEDGAREMLEEWRPQIADRLPRQVPAAAFIAHVATGLQTSKQAPQLLQVHRENPGSLQMAILEAARFGLMPFTEEATIVPFLGKHPEAAFIPQYKGLIKAMFNTGMVDAVVAQHIYEGDEWEESYGEGGRFWHRPRRFGPKGEKLDRGEKILAYCYVRLRSGGMTEPAILTREEAEDIRDNYSKSYANAEKNKRRDSAWHTDFDNQWLKSAIRRVRAPKSAELVELLMVDARSDTTHPEWYPPAPQTPADVPALPPAAEADPDFDMGKVIPGAAEPEDPDASGPDAAVNPPAGRARAGTARPAGERPLRKVTALLDAVKVRPQGRAAAVSALAGREIASLDQLTDPEADKVADGLRGLLAAQTEAKPALDALAGIVADYRAKASGGQEAESTAGPVTSQDGDDDTLFETGGPAGAPAPEGPGT